MYLVGLCTVTAAQDVETPSKAGMTTPTRQNHQATGSGAFFDYTGPYILRADGYTLVFPVAVRRSVGDSREQIPFLLAIQHCDDAMLTLSSSWTNPTPLRITTSRGNVVCELSRSPDEEGAISRDAEVLPSHAAFAIHRNDGTPDKRIAFDLNGGRTIAVSLEEDATESAIQQIRTDLLDATKTLPAGGAKSSIQLTKGISAWWSDTVQAQLPFRRDQSESGHGCVEDNALSQDIRTVEDRHQQTRSDLQGEMEGKAECSESRRSITYLEDSTSRVLNFRGPFLVRAENYTLLFPIARADATSSDEPTLKETIPFLLAIKRPGDDPVVSAIHVVPFKGHVVFTQGELLVGCAPSIYVTHMYSGWSEEEMTITTEEASGDRRMTFDLARGRVFELATDQEDGTASVRQLQVDLYDPGANGPLNDDESVRLEVSNVVDWWNKVNIGLVK